VAHAREAAPAECCGLLIGRAGEILRADAAANLATLPTRFLIDPKSHIDLRKRARDEGLSVLGFYHSHPASAAVPSATDLEESSYSDVVHLIVGLRGDVAEIRLFRIDGQAFEEIPLTTV